MNNGHLYYFLYSANRKEKGMIMWRPRLVSLGFIVVSATLMHIFAQMFGAVTPLLPKTLFEEGVYIFGFLLSACVVAVGLFRLIVSFGVEPAGYGRFRPRDNTLGRLISRVAEPGSGYCATSLGFGIAAMGVIVLGLGILGLFGYIIYDPLIVWIVLGKVWALLPGVLLVLAILVPSLLIGMLIFWAPFWLRNRGYPRWGWLLGLLELGILAYVMYTYGKPLPPPDWGEFFSIVGALVAVVLPVVLIIFAVKYLPGYDTWLCPRMEEKKEE